MPRQIDVEPTAQKIDEMVSTAKRLVTELEYAAIKMRERNSLDYASEAVIAVVNAMPNFRLDLMVTRPMRELMK